MPRLFHSITFGCQMNFNDSQWLTRALKQRNFEEGTLQEASVIIVNTCSVREKPEQKVYNTLRKIRHESRHTENAFVVVAGCVAQQLGEKLFDAFSQVRLISGGDGIAMVPAAIERLCEEPHTRLSFVDFSEHYPERPAALEHMDASQKKPAIAYVNIMQGCDNFCAYCIVPYTRGPQKSRHSAAVLDECRQWLDKGVREICLLGQNVNAFAHDCTEETDFALLLRKIALLPGLERLQFITPHPKDFSDATIEVIGEIKQISPHLHLPLQSGSDRVLASMGRGYTREQYVRIVKALRQVRPDISFSSDIIVGFPGEEEEDFLQTCSLIEEVALRSSFSFCYSDRPGTRASILPNKIKVTHDVALERLSRLQALQDTLTQDWLQGRVGKSTHVLLEHISKRLPEKVVALPCDLTRSAELELTHWQGRDPHGVTINVALPKHACGDCCGLFVPVNIVAAKKHTLLGEQAGDLW